MVAVVITIGAFVAFLWIGAAMRRRDRLQEQWDRHVVLNYLAKRRDEEEGEQPPSDVSAIG